MLFLNDCEYLPSSVLKDLFIQCLLPGHLLFPAKQFRVVAAFQVARMVRVNPAGSSPSYRDPTRSEPIYHGSWALKDDL